MKRRDAVPARAQVVVAWGTIFLTSLLVAIAFAAGALIVSQAFAGGGERVALRSLTPVEPLAPVAKDDADFNADAEPIDDAPAPEPTHDPAPTAPPAADDTPAPMNTAANDEAPPAPGADVPMFDGRPLEKVKTIRMRVTAYSPDERSCGPYADGITASGYSVWTNGMRLVAADTDLLPFKTIVSVPGYNGDRPVQVLDRGGAIKGNRLDVLYGSHEQALVWGVQHLEVTVWRYAD